MKRWTMSWAAPMGTPREGCHSINACDYAVIELDESRYPGRGWQASLLNADVMRRMHARSYGPGSPTFDNLYW